MPMFICLRKDKWVTGRCQECLDNCGLDHAVTQEHGARLFGAGFDKRKPAQPPSPDSAKPE